MQAKLKVHAVGGRAASPAEPRSCCSALFALVGAAIFALALVMPYWASALIVGAVLLLIAVLLALLRPARHQETGMPTPDAAVAEALATVEMVKEEVP